MFQRIMKAFGYVRASEVKQGRSKVAKEEMVSHNYKPIKYGSDWQQWRVDIRKRTIIQIGITRLQHDLLTKYASQHDMSIAECARQILRGTIPPIKKNAHDRGTNIKSISIAISKSHVIEFMKMFDTNNSSLLANRIRAKLFV